jgi:hypothetical protein
MENIDKILKESTKFKINRYKDRIELFDLKTFDYICTIPKQELKKEWLLKIIC